MTDPWNTDPLNYHQRMLAARNEYLAARKEMTRPVMEVHARIYPQGLSAGYLKDEPKVKS